MKRAVLVDNCCSLPKNVGDEHIPYDVDSSQSLGTLKSCFSGCAIKSWVGGAFKKWLKIISR